MRAQELKLLVDKLERRLLAEPDNEQVQELLLKARERRAVAETGLSEAERPVVMNARGLMEEDWAA